MNSIPVDQTNTQFECLSTAPKFKRLNNDESEIAALRAEVAAMRGEAPQQVQSTDRDGVPLWLIECLIETIDQGTSIERVTVASLVEPTVARGDRLTFDGLVARPWAFTGNRGEVRSGVSLNASGVRKATGKKGEPATASGTKTADLTANAA